jgi:predicted SPOUT superfamily RNA methylase MTH1
LAVLAQAEKWREKIMIPRRAHRVSIAIPSSLVSEVPHLREKTGVIGQVARAAAIYRVEDIYIFRDEPDESNLIRLVLSYMETPQYLRRRLFRKRPELSYVGILHPLRTPHHPLDSSLKQLSAGEFREGVVVSEESGGALVDIGVEIPLSAAGRAPSTGSRATVRVTSITPELRGVFARRKDIDAYWGFQVHNVGGGIEKIASSREFDLKIATSRNGRDYTQVEVDLQTELCKATNVLVSFGSPKRGLQELLQRNRVNLEQTFDFILNTIPKQGCETVRTEEAIHATLALLNTMNV